MAYREKVESMLSIKVEVVVECAVQSLEQQNAPPGSQGRPKLRQPAQDSKVQKLVGANCKGSQKKCLAPQVWQNLCQIFRDLHGHVLES